MNTLRIRKNAIGFLLIGIVLLCCVVGYYKTGKRINNTGETQHHNQPRKSSCPLPPKAELKHLPHSKLAALYHGYISELQVGCDNIVRLGEEADGGWDVCSDEQYKPQKTCLVYSFGIDYDFSFDDAIAEKYGCRVHSFDPSMKMKDEMRKPNVWFHPLALGHKTQTLRGNEWSMYTLTDLKNKFNHPTESITVLKIDIEEWEMLALPQMISDGVLQNIKQLLIEFHITTRPEPNQQRYQQGLDILIDLYNIGFRIFWTKRNLFCRFTSFEGDIERTGCHEVSFVNVMLK